MKRKKTKTSYRLRNWREYNSALVQRGSLTLWINDEVMRAWRNTESEGKRGQPRTDTETAILTRATRQEVYPLPLRQTEGLRGSSLRLLKVELPVPDPSPLSRRRTTLAGAVPRTRGREALPVGVDSTGVKVVGEGEWNVRQHGYTYRRTWRQGHLGVDEASGEIVAAGVTTTNYSESQVLPDWLAPVDEAGRQVSGAGGYDRRKCYEAMRERPAQAPIPPQHMPRFGHTATPKPRAWPGMRSGAGSARSGAPRGSARAATIGAAGPRRPCFGSRASLATAWQHAASRDRRRRCWGVAPR